MKKIILIIAIVFCIFQMIVLAAAISIGNAAIDRPGYTGSNTTLVERMNPANATGKITSVEVYTYEDCANAQVGIFYVASGLDNLSTRDWEYIGTITAGAKRTFTVNLDVEEGDFIGIYIDGKLEVTLSGIPGIWLKGGDNVPCDDVPFTTVDNRTISLYGTGTTEEEEANAIFFGINF